MQIKKTFEHRDGTLLFEAELTPEEVSMVVEVGLNTLFANGSIPFTKVDAKDIAKVGPLSDSVN